MPAAWWRIGTPTGRLPGGGENDWQKGGTGRIHFDPEVKRHGLASVRIEGVREREIHISSVTAHIAVEPEARYVLRFWSRRKGEGGEASCQILAHRMADERHSKPIGWVRPHGRERLPIVAGEEWLLHEIPLGPLPGGTARLYFYFRVKGDTVLWIDEFSLAPEGVAVELGGATPLADSDYAGIRLADAELPDNLLRNGGFEQGMEHWQNMGATVVSAAARDKAATGEVSLRIEGREFKAGGVYQRVRIDPRRRYRLSFRANSPDLTGFFFTKVLGFDREGHPRGWLGGEALYSSRDGAWTERGVEFTPLPSTDQVVVYLRVEDTIGDVWVDEVRLEPLPMASKEGGR